MIVTLPEAGAVQVHQTDLPPALPTIGRLARFPGGVDVRAGHGGGRTVDRRLVGEVVVGRTDRVVHRIIRLRDQGVLDVDAEVIGRRVVPVRDQRRGAYSGPCSRRSSCTDADSARRACSAVQVGAFGWGTPLTSAPASLASRGVPNSPR